MLYKNELYSQALMIRSMYLMEKIMLQKTKKHGLGIRTFSLLAAIQQGADTNTKMAEYVDSSLSTVAQQIKTLEDRGLIKRKIDSKDKRIWRFILTMKGQRVVLSVAPSYINLVRKVYKSIPSKDVATLVESLKKIEKKFHEIAKDVDEFKLEGSDEKTASIMENLDEYDWPEMREKEDREK